MLIRLLLLDWTPESAPAPPLHKEAPGHGKSHLSPALSALREPERSRSLVLAEAFARIAALPRSRLRSDNPAVEAIVNHPPVRAEINAAVNEELRRLLPGG